MHQALDFLRHLDTYLNSFAAGHPHGVYILLMAIIFCETGLVVTPFLPGDSLLFALGALAAGPESGLSLVLLFVLLCIAAVVGDAANYAIFDASFAEGDTDSTEYFKKLLHVAIVCLG